MVHLSPTMWRRSLGKCGVKKCALDCPHFHPRHGVGCTCKVSNVLIGFKATGDGTKKAIKHQLYHCKGMQAHQRSLLPSDEEQARVIEETRRRHLKLAFNTLLDAPFDITQVTELDMPASYKAKISIIFREMADDEFSFKHLLLPYVEKKPYFYCDINGNFISFITAHAMEMKIAPLPTGYDILAKLQDGDYNVPDLPADMESMFTSVCQGWSVYMSDKERVFEEVVRQARVVWARLSKEAYSAYVSELHDAGYNHIKKRKTPWP